jgi:hypothetical protein
VDLVAELPEHPEGVGPAAPGGAEYDLVPEGAVLIFRASVVDLGEPRADVIHTVLQEHGITCFVTRERSGPGDVVEAYVLAADLTRAEELTAEADGAAGRAASMHRRAQFSSFHEYPESTGEVEGDG